MATSDEETEERLEHVRTLIREITRRLRRQETKAAQYGRECPVSIEIEIEDLRTELVKLTEELNQLEGTLPRPVILILDPSDMSEIVQRIVVRRFGDAYDVVLAQSALEVVAWASKRRVVLLITEIFLGTSNAGELIRTVQAVSPRTEIIVQTAAWSLGTEWRVRKLGVHYYIEKPFLADELGILVDQALARTRR